MKRVTTAVGRTHPRRLGRPPTAPQRLPRVRRTELPKVKLPRQSRTSGGKTKLTNHRAARILHAIGCGCYRETAAELAGVTRESLTNWMRWDGEPYLTFQRLVRQAEANLEARMVTALTSQAEVRPELALAILERKFPERWAKVSVVATPPTPFETNLAELLERARQARDVEPAARGSLPTTVITDGRGNTPMRPADPRPPKPVAAQDEAQLTQRPVLSISSTTPDQPTERPRGAVLPPTITRLGRPRS